MKVATENQDWILCLEDQDQDWKRVLVISKSRKVRKTHFIFGWNGERLSRNHDTEILNNLHPGVLDWVTKELNR